MGLRVDHKSIIRYNGGTRPVGERCCPRLYVCYTHPVATFSNNVVLSLFKEIWSPQFLKLVLRLQGMDRNATAGGMIWEPQLQIPPCVDTPTTSRRNQCRKRQNKAKVSRGVTKGPKPHELPTWNLKNLTPPQHMYLRTQ